MKNPINIIDDLSQEFEWSNSKVAVMKSYLKRFIIECLNINNPTQCSFERLKLNKIERKELILNKIKGASPQTVKNIISELNSYYTASIKKGFIQPKEEIMKLERRNIFKDSYKILPRVDKDRDYFFVDGYGLKISESSDKLKFQYNEWVDWCTTEYKRGIENRNNKIRQTTVYGYTNCFTAFFGYLHNIKKIEVESISFESLQDIELIKDFVEWHVNVRMKGRMSVQIVNCLKCYRAFLNNYPKFKKKKTAKKIAKILRSFDPPEPKYNKEEILCTYEELISCGESEYPDRDPIDSNGLYFASRASGGLMVMLLANNPMRNKNFREAKIDEHIYKKKNGNYELKFTGIEGDANLKIARRKRKLNVYKFEIHSSLTPYIDKWLNHWRPLILKYNNINSEDNNNLFINTKGIPFTSQKFSKHIQKVTYKWLGKRIKPHHFRDIIASQLHMENVPAGVIASHLNDEIRTIIENYVTTSIKDVQECIDNWKDKKTAGMEL